MTETHTQLEADIAGLIRDPVASLGFAVLRVRFQGGCLEVMAEPQDHTSGMTIDDCARISRHISPPLAASAKLDARYRLEVTTPGIARPLFTRADYARFVGKHIKVTTHALIDGRRRFSGRLLEVRDTDSGGNIVLDTEAGRVVLDYAMIDSGKLDAAAILAEAKQNGTANGKGA